MKHESQTELKIRLLNNTDTGESSVFNHRLRIAEYIVDKYWKTSENKDSKGSTAAFDSLKTSKLKFKGMKDNEVKKYVSCNDTKKPICTAEDGSEQEVDVYWRLKTKKQKEDEENLPIITPFIVLP